MYKTEKNYIIISGSEDPGKTWEKNLQDSLGICKTFTKAYKIALFLGKIKDPDMKYKKALALMHQNGAVTVSQTEGPEKATIVNGKIY